MVGTLQKPILTTNIHTMTLYIISYLISGAFGATVPVLTDCQGLAECEQENSTLRETIQIHKQFCFAKIFMIHCLNEVVKVNTL